MTSSRSNRLARCIRLALMAAPLVTQDQTIGIIYVDSPSAIKQFSEEDLGLLTVMGNVAAIRLEHVRLLEIEQADRDILYG